MSPWELLEWAVAVSVSLGVIVGAVFGVTIGIRYIVGLTSKADWFKK